MRGRFGGRGIALALLIALGAASPLAAADLDAFWAQPRKGGNSFNETPPDAAYFRALAGTGATWVRLTFSKWKGAGGRDFLIGDCDRYDGLVPADLAVLRRVLDHAHAAGLEVVLVPLGLPGARWVQQNGNKVDDRLWSQPAYGEQAVRFWGDLAAALKDHPAIAAYNLLNEPVPEKNGGAAEHDGVAAQRAWQQSVAGTPRDLRGFYAQAIAAIRKADALTPVMVDAGWYANPRALAAWPAPLDDPRVLYAVHMYEPWEATSAPNMKRKQPLRYPGTPGRIDGKRMAWDRDAVAAHIGLAYDWAKAQGLPPTRIVVGEFGCMRLWADCGTYLRDVADAVDARGGHWAFYSFREDAWDGMDYELPPSVTSGRFYWLRENGKAGELPRDGALMGFLHERMRGGAH